RTITQTVLQRTRRQTLRHRYEACRYDRREDAISMARSNVVGCIETVSLPALGVTGVLAKIDTGAYSGALHCTDIRIVRRGLIRNRYLKFTFFFDDTATTE